MNTLAEQVEDSGRGARKKTLSNVDSALNDRLIELAEKQKEKAVVSVAGVSELVGIHERTLRSNGFPAAYSNTFESCTWQKWEGLVIDIPDYLYETELRTKEKLEELYYEGVVTEK